MIFGFRKLSDIQWSQNYPTNNIGENQKLSSVMQQSNFPIFNRNDLRRLVRQKVVQINHLLRNKHNSATRLKKWWSWEWTTNIYQKRKQPQKLNSRLCNKSEFRKSLCKIDTVKKFLTSPTIPFAPSFFDWITVQYTWFNRLTKFQSYRPPQKKSGNEGKRNRTC